IRSGPASGLTPSAIGLLSSVIAQVTELSGRGSGSPAGPSGLATTSFAAALETSPAASEAPIGVVVFSHPARAPAALRPTAATADLRSSSRRLMPDSLGCTFDPSSSSVNYAPWVIAGRVSLGTSFVARDGPTDDHVRHERSYAPTGSDLEEISPPGRRRDDIARDRQPFDGRLGHPSGEGRMASAGAAA